MERVGLNDRELNLILGVLSRHKEIISVILFGSRAKGTASPASDIDLAIDGIDDPLQAAAIASELEDLPLPYRFDVKALRCIKSQPLREHIERVGVKIYG
jgi:predicted nucleotidyltransferase